MRVFACPTCSTAVYFDSLSCEECEADLFYDPDVDDIVDVASDARTACTARDTVEACNWPSATADGWCRSCALDDTHTPAPLRVPFQRAKRRTIRQLLAHGVDPGLVAPPLRFEMKEGTAEEPVTIGHADGVVTLDLTEADPAEREEVRTSLGEPYRTPLGHVRHELGHWYWQATVGFGLSFDEVRARFGDETVDYADALEAHYSSDDDGSWSEEFVSFYAAAHPWEDFAESFAHYLHILDTTETAVAHGIGPFASVDVAEPTTEELVLRFADLTVVVNDLNRAMGTRDPYPFVLSPTAMDKIVFVGRSLRAGVSPSADPATLG